MKRLLIIASVIVLVLLTAAMTVPYLVPSSVYRAQIEKSASTALGREVTLVGETKISVFPSISVKIGGAQVANPEGFEVANMIDAGELKGSVKLWPLLARKVEVSQITLSDATIRLERLADGRANWEFGTPGVAPGEEDPQDARGSGFTSTIGKAALNNTAIYFHDRQAKQQYTLTDFNALARLKALDAPFSSSGDGQLNGQAFEYDITLNSFESIFEAQPSELKLDLKTDLGDVNYDGAITLSETPEFDGSFRFSSASIGSQLAVLAPDLPIRGEAVESLAGNGTISGALGDISLRFQQADVKAVGLDGSYKGDIVLTDTIHLDGTFKINANGAERLLKADHAARSLLSTLGKVDISGTVRGEAVAPNFSDIQLAQRSELLTTDYSGDLSISDSQSIDGTLSLESKDFRALLASMDQVLPPGETLNSFSFSGDTSGTFTNITIQNARLALDDTTATGTIGADLRGSTPRIIADLSMAELDLTPLMGQSSDQPKHDPSLSQDWSDDPLALDSLNLINATVNISANRVILDQITLQDALLKTRLDDGRLSAIFRRDEEQPGFRAFSGNWSGDIVLDASGSTPRLTINALADSIAAQDMLGALTGFNRLIGLGDVLVDVSSEGNSLKALVNGLDGRFESDLSNGALRGINLAKLVRDSSNMTELLKSGDLTIASFREAFSPDAETDFSSFIGSLSFTNGVAQIQNLKLDNPVVAVTGSGSINLGTRMIDISLTPTIDLKAQRQGGTLALGDIPVPVRIYGSWANPKYGFDTAAIRSELTARARGRIADEIVDEVGGDLGNILGQVVGGKRPNQSPAQAEPGPAEEADSQTSTTPEAPPKSIEDEIKDRAIEGALGAIFGNQPEDEPAEPAPE